MREILFRGKRADDGEWKFGHYDSDLYGAIIRTPNGSWAEINHVDSETVGQFTGLTDLNGEKIFEGDIIKLAQSGKCYAVKYKSGCFCIGINWAISHEPDCEVIGNIHDNPELLEADCGK